MNDHIIQLCFGPRGKQEFRWPDLPPKWHVSEGGGWYERSDDEPSETLAVRYWWREEGNPLAARQQALETALRCAAPRGRWKWTTRELMTEGESFHAQRSEVARAALQRIADWDYRGQTAESIARTALILTEVTERRDDP